MQDRLSALRQAKPDSWIALSPDESRVVGCGNTYAEAVERAQEAGETEPVIIKTPESWLPTLFSACL